jgi:ABC-type sugar transport system ATPase subunit
MGMMFQKGGLFTDLTVFENVAFPIREHTSLPESLIHDLALMKLHAVGLRGAQRLARTSCRAACRGAWRSRAPPRWIPTSSSTTSPSPGSTRSRSTSCATSSAR